MIYLEIDDGYNDPYIVSYSSFESFWEFRADEFKNSDCPDQERAWEALVYEEGSVKTDLCNYQYIGEGVLIRRIEKLNRILELVRNEKEIE